jgi:hypothetical protein
MNCPKCGRLPFPRMRQCLCGELLAWPPAPVKKKPMHPVVAQRLDALGFEQRPGETPKEFADRCRRYMLDRFVCTERRGDRAA